MPLNDFPSLDRTGNSLSSSCKRPVSLIFLTIHPLRISVYFPLARTSRISNIAERTIFLARRVSRTRWTTVCIGEYVHNDLLYCCIDACIVALIGDTSNHHKLLYLSQLPLVSLHESFFSLDIKSCSLSLSNYHGSLYFFHWSFYFVFFYTCFFNRSVSIWHRWRWKVVNERPSSTAERNNQISTRYHW